MNGPQPIQITDVMSYCAMAGIADPAERMRLLFIVQAMDGEYLAWAARQAEARRSTKS